LYLVKGQKDLTRWQRRPRYILNVVTKTTLPENNSSNGELTQIPENFDINTAVELMQLSIYAYDQYTDFKNNKIWSIPDSSYSVVKTLYSTSENGNPPIGFIATKLNEDNVKVIYVAWRGTRGAVEWMHDADFTQIEFLSNNGPKVEKGFYDLYTITNNSSNPPPRQIVIDYLNEIWDASTTVPILCVTGHSLGAALAVLNTYDIVTNTKFKEVKTYNFAGPRAGSPAFADAFNTHVNLCWRVVNINDTVPTLPPTSLLFNLPPYYNHVEGCGGNCTTPDNPDTNPGLFQITFGKKSDPAVSHSAATYLEMLKGIKSNLEMQSRQAFSGFSGAKHALLKMAAVTRYGSASLAGRLSSKYPHPVCSTELGMRMLAPRLPAAKLNVRASLVSHIPFKRSELSP
jgi:triacylglycerol lipase